MDSEGKHGEAEHDTEISYSQKKASLELSNYIGKFMPARTWHRLGFNPIYKRDKIYLPFGSHDFIASNRNERERR